MGWDLCMFCCFTSTSDTFRMQNKLMWKIFSYEQLRKATNYFDQAHILGKKGSATIYYGKKSFT